MNAKQTKHQQKCKVADYVTLWWGWSNLTKKKKKKNHCKTCKKHLPYQIKYDMFMFKALANLYK